MTAKEHRLEREEREAAQRERNIERAAVKDLPRRYTRDPDYIAGFNSTTEAL